MELFYKEESFKIVGAAYQVYNTLGHGFAEAIYQEALEIEFQRRGIPYQREKEIDVYYDGILLQKKFFADFVCYDKIIVELKAVMKLDDANRSQIYNYLWASNFKVGWLLNFGNPKELEKERKVF